MRATYVNIAAVGAALAVFAGFEVGLIEPRNAFFAAAVILAAFTTHQVLARAHLPFRQAMVSIFTQPESHGTPRNYAAYVSSAGLSVLLVIQTLTYI